MGNILLLICFDIFFFFIGVVISSQPLIPAGLLWKVKEFPHHWAARVYYPHNQGWWGRCSARCVITRDRGNNQARPRSILGDLRGETQQRRERTKGAVERSRSTKGDGGETFRAADKKGKAGAKEPKKHSRSPQLLPFPLKEYIKLVMLVSAGKYLLVYYCDNMMEGKKHYSQKAGQIWLKIKLREWNWNQMELHF